MNAAIIPIEREEVTPPSIHEMDSESLGILVRDGIIGVATKLVELKPYVEELWRRLESSEVILNCSTKKEFCQQVLQRTSRAVRYMLEGGNHNRGETVSPSKSRKSTPHQVNDAEFAKYEASHHKDVRKSAQNMLAQGKDRDCRVLAPGNS